ncbi:TPA: hypothetical protein RQK21_003230 [Vibrio vulnificus]|uniref:hypothetical protein n=1 Tax=Vibrio TaxID=662 RepID=UPI0010237C3A|nr:MULTISPECIES: hypothetical protein [Vibrio]MCX8843557.1 hypothetical protein [Vibrio parahaemolyticus]RZP62739.1 hypothetical protein D8T45_15750 [Vibrio vulnificus]RZR12609.1 hypothetical protein D8T24_15810 [Vibrio vulnificus]HDY7744137.1 hypothetical protein [Vibrio vulnificus]HDY7780903.1 hypothetical protein [Vibrio vulnificus]
MSSDLLQKLGLPRTQVVEVLTRLATNKKVIERQKDGPLLAHLKSLRIAHCAGRLWHLDNPERLAQLRQQIGLEEGHVTKARGAIVRNTELVHHKCAAAWRGDSKSGRSEPLLPTQAVTSDEVIRVRSSKTGLTVTYPSWQQSVDDETEARSECTIPERLWREKHRLSFADIKLIMTVENLGAFVDLPLVEGLVLLYVPGLNLTHTELLASLPATVPWVAFPDYDPNGLSIVQTMANKLGRPARIWLPGYWQDQAAQRSREMIGTSKRGWLDAPSLSLPGLSDVQRWLEQEVLVLDHRCDAALNDLVSDELGIVSLN